MSADPLISIVIPVKNGAFWLEGLFQAIQRQTLASRAEIIIIDSGSTDESLSIAGRYPVKVITIPPETFNHGGTRNLGVRAARGKFVMMTVQDALPADDRWLEKLLEGFDDDSVAAVCGQQIVRPDKEFNPVQWFRPISEPAITKYHFSDAAGFQTLSPVEKRAVCGFDNVNTLYAREALLKVPFRQINFAEDIQWAKDALLAGFTIGYNYASQVFHYHHESAEYTYKRTFTECYHLYRILGYLHNADDGFLPLLRDAKLLIKEGRIGLSARIRWWFYNYRTRAAANKAIRDFNTCLSKDEAGLDRVHAKICGVSPQAPKPLVT